MVFRATGFGSTWRPWEYLAERLDITEFRPLWATDWIEVPRGENAPSFTLEVPVTFETPVREVALIPALRHHDLVWFRLRFRPSDEPAATFEYEGVGMTFPLDDDLHGHDFKLRSIAHFNDDMPRLVVECRYEQPVRRMEVRASRPGTWSIWAVGGAMRPDELPGIVWVPLSDSEAWLEFPPRLPD